MMSPWRILPHLLSVALMLELNYMVMLLLSFFCLFSMAPLKIRFFLFGTFDLIGSCKQILFLLMIQLIELRDSSDANHQRKGNSCDEISHSKVMSVLIYLSELFLISSPHFLKFFLQ